MTRWKPTEREVVAIVARQIHIRNVEWQGDIKPYAEIVCPICDKIIFASQIPECERDHDDAIGFGSGRDTLENCRYVHGHCHRKKTGEDRTRMAKADRQGGKTGQKARRDRNGGSRIKGRGFDKTLKKKFDGTVERRT